MSEKHLELPLYIVQLLTENPGHFLQGELPKLVYKSNNYGL